MKLLHKKSIYESNYEESLRHDKEIDDIISKLLSLPDYHSEFQLRFEDDYHKEMNVPLDYTTLIPGLLHSVKQLLPSNYLQRVTPIVVRHDSQNFIICLNSCPLLKKWLILKLQTF